MKKLLVPLLVLLVLLLAVAPISADPPDRITIPIDFFYPLVTCDDFYLWSHVVANLTVTTFYDRDGITPERIQFHLYGAAQYYRCEVDNPENPEACDYVTTHNFTFTHKADPETTAGILNGLYTGITLPGYGNIWFNAGRGFAPWAGSFIYEPISGHHENDVDALCAAVQSLQ